MSILGLRGGTLVDASVNLIPTAILLWFMGLFIVADPWRLGARSWIVSQGLLVIPIVLVLLVTAIAARVIQVDGTAAK